MGINGPIMSDDCEWRVRGVLGRSYASRLSSSPPREAVDTGEVGALQAVLLVLRRRVPPVRPRLQPNLSAVNEYM